ncbi:MAG: TolC family outer membrane protein [Novosphingobium sp.]
MIRYQRRLLASAVLAVCLAGTPALADDLREALTLAYQTNPTLNAARANQRAVDEGVPIARAAGLPSLSGTTSFTEFVKKSPLNTSSPDRAFDAQANLSVPIYSGGAVKNSLRAAETRVDAGQADLRGSESGLFSQVVAAYLDVISGQALVTLNRNNVAVLDTNLSATRDRYEIGDLTRTDVAQSQARLATARGNLRTSEANLASTREKYIQLVGKPPVDLAPPPPLPGMPASADEAETTALDSNPDLIAARQRTKATGFDTRAAGAGRLPKVSLFSGVDYTDYLGTLSIPGVPAGTIPQRQTTSQAGVRASIPIFSGGLPAAQQRQAQARENAVQEQEIGVERAVVAGVRSAFSQWQAALEVIQTNQTAVDAAALSLEGVRAENSVGNRTILDILNAEQEYLNAQTQLVTARRNAYVAGFNLLSAMGKAESRDLGLDGGVFYDPEVNYNRVHAIIWDWSTDPAPRPKATRTVDTPVQDGAIPAK